MMRLFTFLFILLLPLKAMATCPELKYINNSIKEIRDRLLKNSEEPLVINGTKFIVQHGGSGKSVDDLLAGNFKGYILDRFKEKIPGVCPYRVRDDRTPVSGFFLLVQQK